MNKRLIIIIITIITSSTLFGQSISETDSLINVVQNINDNTEKVDIYNDLCWKLKYEDFNLSFEYGRNAVLLSQKLDYTEGLALAYKNLGGIHYLTSDYNNAFLYYDSSLTYYNELQDSAGISKITRNMGSVMHQQGNYDKAVEYFLKSLDIRKALGDEIAEADIYNSLGLVYSEQGDVMFDQAKNNYFEALKIYMEISDTVGQAESYYRIGAMYLNKKAIEIDSALSYYNKFLELAIYLDDRKQIAQAYEGLGLISLKKENYDESEKYFLESEKIWIELDNKFSIASIYNNLGELYLKKNNIEKALKYALDANDLSILNDIPMITKQSDLSLMLIYEQLGDNAKALYFSKHYSMLADSLQGEEMKQAITRMEVKHEFEKQMQEQEQMQERLNIEHEAQLNRQRIISVFTFIALVLMIGVVVLILKSYRQKKRANRMLELMNREISNKNEILNQQKEEIETQRDEIEKQRDTVIGQKDEIEKQKESITDSIIYAKRIQSALLPPEDFVNELFPENFILFFPRDIVSGDFYWAAKKDNLKIITAVDCTGHGVPGAFMSMLGVSFLNEIVSKIRTEQLNAGIILDELRNFVKKSLRQTGKENEAKDGMDISLCVIDSEKNILHFAGAHNPLVRISGDELICYDADRMPIGIHIKEKENFENNIIEYKPNDLFYLYSDGYVDQFGGYEGKKFMSKRFKNMLFEMRSIRLFNQKEKLAKTFKDWISAPDLPKKFDQIDDICVIGFKL